MGLSQGALIARHIATHCKIQGKVRNLLSIGGPNMGVTDVPHCFKGILCSMVNKVVRSVAYMGLLQHHIGPLGYWRDPASLDEYVEKSVFLPTLNNERGTDEEKAAAKARFTGLNNVMNVMFSQDSMVYPKESEQFQELDNHDRKVKALDQSDFYTADYLGLKQMTDAGKVQLKEIDGDHLQFSKADISDIFVPFLLS